MGERGNFLPPLVTSSSRASAATSTTKQQRSGILTAYQESTNDRRNDIELKSYTRPADTNPMSHAVLPEQPTIRDLIRQARAISDRVKNADDQKLRRSTTLDYHRALREMQGLGAEPARQFCATMKLKGDAAQKAAAQAQGEECKRDKGKGKGKEV